MTTPHFPEVMHSIISPPAPPDYKLRHMFVRSDDPAFGAAFGGGCVVEIEGITCGYPESAHPRVAQLAREFNIDPETGATQ